MEKTWQINNDGHLILDFDQKFLTYKEIEKIFIKLGLDKEFDNIRFSRTKVEIESGNISVCILFKSVSYLGKPHPIYKKRIQIPNVWEEIFIRNSLQNKKTIMLGLYKYGDMNLFVDFNSETYFKPDKKINNSSAHVYINDLRLGNRNGIFTKIDKKKNVITVVTENNILDYLKKQYFNIELNIEKENELKTIVDIFHEFNTTHFNFNKNITVNEAIEEMHKLGSKDFGQVEWPGFYLEAKFKDFLKVKKIPKKIIEFTSKKHKQKNPLLNVDDLDFDLEFFNDNNKVYGELKSSDRTQDDAPWNDKSSLELAFEIHSRFIVALYEFDSIKAKDLENKYEINNSRLNLTAKLKNVTRTKSDTSYLDRLKASVDFKQSSLICIDKDTFEKTKKDFKQGRQQSTGKPRKLKLQIVKKEMKELGGIYFYSEE